MQPNSPILKRVSIKGKFLYANEQKFYIKGVTYGTFKQNEDARQFPTTDTVEKDFSLMAANSFNSVRTYTVPPKYVLNLALKYNLKVMVGLPWEQHITFLDTAERRKDIIQRVRNGVLSCENHPAVLCYTVGNEIPAHIVRWYGKAKIERFLKCLYKAVKQADPHWLVTYVNYPTTEYLDLSFLDFDCFNVYLETPEKLSKYIFRLHNLSGDRPLVLAEIGLDSLRNGLDNQADVLKWQIETVLGNGCAGMFVFAWTDEWWRGGFEIEDWNFGLVDRKRNPKPALFSVLNAVNNVPFRSDTNMPFISVIVCSYNGSATIKDTLDGLMKLSYPNFEVIVVNDGSRDNLVDVVKQYPVKLVSTSNSGLSCARNTGMHHANGEILAYIDDDAYPEEHWLHYLAYAYTNSSHAAIGGPNIVPEEDGPIATCVANAPGGPNHVLVTDEIAEHVPGCNLSVRKKVLEEIGGFDPVYRAAGDDVDVCWRIQEAGYTIGFHPSAQVWHHRRNSLKAYWKQQQGYGKAEALLEHKWPEKYNCFGHLTWTGRIYGNGCTLPLPFEKGKVFYGTWGTALFQSIYQPGSGYINGLPLMPEWYFVVALLGMLSFLGLLWVPLFWTFIVFIGSLVVIVIQAFVSAYKSTSLPPQKRSWKYYLLIVVLHMMQPLARLYGRTKHGLTPWRKRGIKPAGEFLFNFRRLTFTCWCETWRSPEDWLTNIEKNLIMSKTRVKRGGNFDRWDLLLGHGMMSVIRALLTIEEHGANKQYVRLKTWCKPTRTIALITSFLLLLSILAAIQQALYASCILALLVSIAISEYIIDRAALLHKLNTAFKESAPSHNPIVQPIPAAVEQEHDSYRVIVDQTLEKGNLYSNKMSLVFTSREKLSRAEEHITTEETGDNRFTAL